MATLADTSLRPAERRAVERLVRLLDRDLGPELDAVWLYGSRARGDPPREESDVDLIVLTRRASHEEEERVSRLAWDVEMDEGFQAYLSPFVFDRTWIEDRRRIGSFFMREVDRDKVVLYGDP